MYGFEYSTSGIPYIRIDDLNNPFIGIDDAVKISEEINKKFDEIVSFAEVERFIDTPVKRYSSGMFVRLAFSVAAHLEPDILVVDEASMVNDALYGFLNKFKKDLKLKIIYMGDPAQLQPVGQEHLSKTLSSGTKFELTKVERTGDNPILLNSTRAREGKGSG